MKELQQYNKWRTNRANYLLNDIYKRWKFCSGSISRLKVKQNMGLQRTAQCRMQDTSDKPLMGCAMFYYPSVRCDVIIDECSCVLLHQCDDWHAAQASLTRWSKIEIRETVRDLSFEVHLAVYEGIHLIISIIWWHPNNVSFYQETVLCFVHYFLTPHYISVSLCCTH